MQLKRVVITGMGAISPFGRGVDALIESLLKGESGVRAVPELGHLGGLRSHVAALVPEIDPKEIPRKHRRSMSKMSIYATLACHEALSQGRVSEDVCAGGQLGVVIGSTVGSIDAMEEFFRDYLSTRTLEKVKSTVFFQIMNHSCAANVAQALGITGRILSPSSACSTSCQAVGYGYEMIALGKQSWALCGGAEEFHPLATATFDIINAASSHFNDRPSQTPRPFDRDRDGVVCAEGSGVVLLESLESAQRRGVDIIAEVIGFATVSDPSNMANPNMASMEICMKNALVDAQLNPEEIHYINAHATGTEQGDTAESQAIHRFFGDRVPVSSLKGHIGHTMAASGALELIATIHMMKGGFLIPTLNLDHVDPSCEIIHHLRAMESREVQAAIKNNFAFGGVNSSIVLRRYEHD